jgi:hypothetical protein
MRFPANVLSGFDDTMGSTFFSLNDLQVGCSCLRVAFLAKLILTSLGYKNCLLCRPGQC